MKKFPKIFAAVMIVCLLCGIVFSIFASADAYDNQMVVKGDGVKSLANFGFNEYPTGSTRYDTGNVTSTNGRTWGNGHIKDDAAITIREHSVNGATNKYLEFVAVDGYTTSGEAAFTNNHNPYPSVISSTVTSDFLIVDVDLRATQYVYIDDDTKLETLTKTKDGLSETELATLKLSYPDGLMFYTPIYSSAGTITRYFNVVTVDNKWYLTTNDSYSTSTAPSKVVSDACQLSNDIDVWNHLTFIYEFKGSTAGYADAINLYGYLNGRYVGMASSSGYKSATSSYLKEGMRIHVLKNVVAKSQPTYAFAIDNWTNNLYDATYTPASGINSIKTMFDSGFDSSKLLTDFDDVVYNKNYISPNGSSFDIDITDTNGDVISKDSVEIGKAPVFDDFALGAIASGDYSNLTAWEWNVGEDETMFTPVSTLTLDMVNAVLNRTDKKITVRPVVLDVSFTDGGGAVLGTEKYFAGSTLDGYSAPTNGWYSAEYPVKSNATEGEAADSFAVVAGKNNVFVADFDKATPKASIEGIRYNMSLLTNYYMNIYVPADMPENVRFLGFYSDSALSNKYTSGVRKVSISDKVYSELSFGFANSDIDVNVPKYVGIEVIIGDKTYELSYEIDVNVLKYCMSVLDIYDCGTEEASLVINLLNYANEAYKHANGEGNPEAEATLAEHTDCGCLVSSDPAVEYKGNIGGLTSYLYGAAYNVTTAQPSLMLYLLADKAEEVSKITVSYYTSSGEVEAVLSPMSATTLNGKSVIPYSYAKISASDVKEVMTITVYGADGAALANGTYSIANYAFNNDVPVANALLAFSKAAAAYKVSVFGEYDAPVVIEGIEAEKSSSLRPSRTISLGDKITYTIKITNNNSIAVDVPVVDQIPANTYYVSGDATVKGHKLFWTVNVGAGETKEISYVVALEKNKELLDKNIILTAPVVNAGGAIAECAGENYIARTINANDAYYMKAGIEAMSYSDEEVLISLGTVDKQTKVNPVPMLVVRYTYNVAFTTTPGIASSETPAGVISAIFEKSATTNGISYRGMVAPTLWGGSAVTSVLSGIKGKSAAVELADLVIGDILFVKDSNGARMYMFDGDGLVSFTYGYESANTASVITEANAADYYAVLRPSMTMKSLITTDPDAEMPKLTPQQEALVKTAYQYVLRGMRLQYDDTGMATSSEHRWQIGTYQPEQTSAQNWKYINCAGFTYDIYRMTLGYDLGSLYTTGNLMQHFTKGNDENGMYPFYFEWDSGIHNDKERQAEIEKRFFDTLEVGDLVVITRGTSTGGYGHVMMYIGNGMLVHSTGANRSVDLEAYEPTIRYMNAWNYLFNPTASNYLFIETPASNTVYQTCIVRPLDKCGNYEIPENTQNRLDNLMGIISEKLSSHPEGKTVNKNDEVTFTYKIKNTNKTTKIIDVTDVVPENSVLVDAPGAIVNGNNLSWTVTVLPGETVEVAYTVKATGEYGSYIYGTEGKVGGVLHTCPKTYIENTLTAEQQAALVAAVEYYKTNNTDGLMNMDLINAIYEKAGLNAPFADGTTAAGIKSSLFKSVTVSGNSLYQFNTSSEYYDMVAPSFYGGLKYYTRNYYSATNKTSSDRSRLPREHSLVIGDIIFAEFSSGSSLFMYLGGDHVISVGQTSASLSTDSVVMHHRLARLLSVGKYYTILRPSMVTE